MAFEYSFKLNGEPLYATLGAVVMDKLEEPLDEGALHIPITVKDYEYRMYGVLEIGIDDGVNTPLVFNYLITSDEIKVKSKNGYFSHDLTAVEYTNKLDKYLINALTFTKPFLQKRRAPFSYLDGADNVFYSNYPKIEVNEFIFTNTVLTIPQTSQALTSRDGISTQVSKDIYVVSDATGNTTLQNLTNGDATFTFTETGNYHIQVGEMISAVFYPVFEHYITVLDDTRYSLYDMIQRVRAVIPVETKYYFDDTRIFDLDASLVDRFSKIQMPQMFFQKMSARQALNTMFKYINAISRLSYVSDGTDTLSVDEFNKVIGTFDMENIVDFKSNQDVQQYATKAITWLENSLQSNFRENPSIETPANGRYKTVRAKNVQLTYTDAGFEIPLERPIYEMHKFEVLIPKFTLDFSTPSIGVSTDFTEYTLDLTARMLEKSMWDLKDNTLNIFTYTEQPILAEFVGLRNFKYGNLFWKRNASSIDLSLEVGSTIKNSLIIEVVKEAINEEITLSNREFFGTNDLVYSIVSSTLINLGDDFYRNLAFNIEYVTFDNPTLQVDRADISNIMYYSEMRINQQEKQTDFTRSSRHSYGQLNRSAVPNQSFTKIFTNLGDENNPMLTVGMIDEDGYIITQRQIKMYNEHLVVNYTKTLNHIRLNEFNGIDQEYRVFENPSPNSLYKRIDYYNDYLIMCNPSLDLGDELTIIEDELMYNVSEVLTGRTSNLNKITGAMVRTDGFLEEYPDTTDYHAIMTPVVANAGKNILNFTFGFNDNLNSGNAIYKDAVGNFYNRPVLYTNQFGFFDELWFGMFSNYVATEDFADIGSASEDIFNREYAYPLIKTTSSTLDQVFKIKTGLPSVSDSSYNPIISYKDASSNYFVSYSIGIIPHDYQEYVVGEFFTDNNRLVKNKTDDDPVLYIYLYTDGTTYGIFNDLEVKNDVSTYTFTKIELVPSTNIRDAIEVDDKYGIHLFGNISMSGVTSWAIADADDNLYIACNSNANGFRWQRRHFRPDVSGIGNKVNQFQILPKVTIDDVLISGGLSVSSTRGTDVIIDDVLVSETLSSQSTRGTDVLMNDVLVYELLNTSYSRGTDVLMSDVVVSETLESTSSKGTDILVNDILVSNQIDSSYAKGTDILITDILLSNILSSSYVASVPTNITISDVLVSTSLLVSYDVLPITPTITYVSRTSSSLSFTLKNNSPYTCTIYYEQDDTTPDANSIVLGAGVTSGLLTISSLIANNEYTVYAQAWEGTKKSYLTSFTATTDMIQLATPSISASCIDSGGTRTLSYSATNNDTEAVIVYLEINDTTPDISRGTIIGGGSTATYDSVITTSVTIYAQAKKTGYKDSEVASRFFNIGQCLI